MSRGKSKVNYTSISEAQAAKFVAESEPGKTLFCERVPNFHLVCQRKGGAWRLRYRDALGKLRTATIGRFPAVKPNDAAMTALEWRKEDADPLRDASVRRQQRQEAVQEADSRVLNTYLTGAYTDQWLIAWKPENADALLRRFTTGNLSRFADKDMATINRRMVKKWQTDMVAKGLKHETIRRDFNDLRSVLNRAVADEVLTENPLKGHKLTPPPVAEQNHEDPQKAKRRLLTPDEMRGILTGLDLFAEEIRRQRDSSRAHGKPYLPDLRQVEFPHWFLPFCTLALATGWRPGDLYALDWAEVDLRFSGRIVRYAEKSKSQALRRGRKPTLLDTPLPASAKGMLQRWWKQGGKPSSGLVFPSPRTGAKLDAQAHKKPWSRVKELGGLPDELEFYSLRHHAISAMIAANVPIMTVAKLVGHKDTKMIAEHYAHLCPDSAATAMDVVAATIAKSATAQEGRRA